MQQHTQHPNVAYLQSVQGLILCPVVYSQVDETTYRSTIERVNEYFDEAESLGCCNVLEGCLSCMTGFALHYCFKTHYERVSSTEKMLGHLQLFYAWLGVLSHTE